MVFDQLRISEDWKMHGPAIRMAFDLGAALHDIEKRSTTIVDEEGHIISPLHAKRGEFTARELIYKGDILPFQVREIITQLVRYHSRPLWVMDRPDPVKSFLETACAVFPWRLAALCRADILGRICEDQEDLLYRLGMFEMLADEWAHFKFPSKLSAFEYFRKDDRDPHYEAFDNSWGKVYITSGLPGTGKSTYAKSLDLPIVSMDFFREKYKLDPTKPEDTSKALALAKEVSREYLRKKQSHIWDTTALTKLVRGPLVNLITEYGGSAEIVYLEVPYLQMHRQNRERDRVVPPLALDKMLTYMQIPQMWEAPEVTYHVTSPEKTILL